MPSTMSSTTPSPVLLTSLLAINPEMSPSTIQAKMDMVHSSGLGVRLLRRFLGGRLGVLRVLLRRGLVHLRGSLIHGLPGLRGHRALHLVPGLLGGLGDGLSGLLHGGSHLGEGETGNAEECEHADE